MQINFNKHKQNGILADVPVLRKGCKSRHSTLNEHSFRAMGPRLWNCIPKHIHSYTVLETFKEHLTRFMLKVPDKPPRFEGTHLQIQTRFLIGGTTRRHLLSTVVGQSSLDEQHAGYNTQVTTRNLKKLKTVLAVDLSFI